MPWRKSQKWDQQARSRQTPIFTFSRGQFLYWFLFTKKLIVPTGTRFEPKIYFLAQSEQNPRKRKSFKNYVLSNRSKMQSRGRTLHTCSHHSRFFNFHFQKWASRANTCAKYRVFETEFWFSFRFCSTFWKYYKTAARSSKVPFGTDNFEYYRVFSGVFKPHTHFSL